MEGSARKIWYLRRLNLFNAMSVAEVEAIAGRLRERPCRRKETVLDPSGAQDRIYFIKSGTVRLYRLNSNGRELTTAILRPGQMFGTSALLERGSENTFAEAMEDAYVCEASAEEFLGLMSSHPLLAAKVTVAMARQLLHMEQQLDRIAFQEVPERVAQILLQMTEESGDPTEALKVTHEELAKLAGTTRETATKVLDEFAAAGLVELGYRRIAVRDVARMRATAHLNDDD